MRCNGSSGDLATILASGGSWNCIEKGIGCWMGDCMWYKVKSEHGGVKLICKKVGAYLGGAE